MLRWQELQQGTLRTNFEDIANVIDIVSAENLNYLKTVVYL